jgi:hypothetical protein
MTIGSTALGDRASARPAESKAAKRLSDWLV